MNSSENKVEDLNLLETLGKLCVVEDMEGTTKSLADINEHTYVAVVGSTDDEKSVLIFIENVEPEDSKKYSVKDFMMSVTENCADIMPSGIRNAQILQNEFSKTNLEKLSHQADGSVWAVMDAYVEYDNHWTAKNQNAGAHSFMMSAKKGDVTLEWIDKQRTDILKSLKSCKNEILSEVAEAKEYEANPSAYYGVGDSDFSSIRATPKLKRF